MFHHNKNSGENYPPSQALFRSGGVLKLGHRLRSSWVAVARPVSALRQIHSKLGRRIRGPRVCDPQRLLLDGRVGMGWRLQPQSCRGSQSGVPGRHFGPLPCESPGCDSLHVFYSATTFTARCCAARLRWVSSRIFLRRRRFFGVASTYSSEPMYSSARSRLSLSGGLS